MIGSAIAVVLLTAGWQESKSPFSERLDAAAKAGLDPQQWAAAEWDERWKGWRSLGPAGWSAGLEAEYASRKDRASVRPYLVALAFVLQATVGVASGAEVPAYIAEHFTDPATPGTERARLVRELAAARSRGGWGFETWLARAALDPDPSVREASFFALGASAKPGEVAVGAMIGALSGPQAALAVQYLPAMLSRMDEKSEKRIRPRVEKALLDATAKGSRPPSARAAAVRSYARLALLGAEEQGEAVLKKLEEMLAQRGDPVLARSALIGLAEAAPPRGRDAVLAALKAKEDEEAEAGLMAWMAGKFEGDDLAANAEARAEEMWERGGSSIAALAFVHSVTRLGRGSAWRSILKVAGGSAPTARRRLALLCAVIAHAEARPDATGLPSGTERIGHVRERIDAWASPEASQVDHMLAAAAASLCGIAELRRFVRRFPDARSAPLGWYHLRIYDSDAESRREAEERLKGRVEGNQDLRPSPSLASYYRGGTIAALARAWKEEVGKGVTHDPLFTVTMTWVQTALDRLNEPPSWLRDVEPAREDAPLRLEVRGVECLTFTPQGQLACGTRDGPVRVFDVSSGKETAVLAGHEGAVSRMVVAADGSLLATAALDGGVRIWDLATGRSRFVLRGSSLYASALAFSPDAKRLAAFGERWTVRVWDTTEGRETLTVGPSAFHVTSVSFSPDGRTLATADGYGNVNLWEAATGKKLAQLEIPSVCFVEFDAGGNTLVAWGYGPEVRLWDVAASKERVVLRGHSRDVTDAAITPDGKVLITAGEDGTLRLWDVSTGREVRRIEAPAAGVASIAVSPDGRALAVAGRDGTVLVRDLPRR